MTKPNKSTKKSNKKTPQQQTKPIEKVSSNLKDSLAKMKKNKKQVKNAAPEPAQQKSTKKSTSNKSAPVATSTEPTTKPTIHTPDFHYKIKLYIGNKRDLKQVSKPVLKILLTMSRIPAQYIKVKIEDDRFMVDTSEWSKKYFIEREYPEGVRVQSEADPKVVYDGNQLALILLLETPVPKAVEEKYFAIATAKHESYNIKLGDAVQPKKKLMQNMDQEEQKASKKRKRKQMEKDFEAQQDSKQQKKRQKRQEKRTKKQASSEMLKPSHKDQ